MAAHLFLSHHQFKGIGGAGAAAQKATGAKTEAPVERLQKFRFPGVRQLVGALGGEGPDQRRAMLAGCGGKG